MALNMFPCRKKRKVVPAIPVVTHEPPRSRWLTSGHNIPTLTKIEYKELLPFSIWDISNDHQAAKIKRLLSQGIDKCLQVDFVPETSFATKYAILADFISCLAFCKQLLTIELRKVGWTKNCTKFEPFRGVTSLPGIISNTKKCYFIALKQRLSLDKFNASLITTPKFVPIDTNR